MFRKLPYYSVLVLLLFSSQSLLAQNPNNETTRNVKYCFLFIGDGMSNTQVTATETYWEAAKQNHLFTGGSDAQQLYMNSLPVHGTQTSFSNNKIITDSAAAGTALACGKKTNNGIVGMNPEATTDYPSVAEKAKAMGMKVGIVTSVSLDHATPAVFYAHSPNRNNYRDIAFQLVDSGFDYFAGGGFKVNSWNKYKEYKHLSNEERYQIIENKAVEKGFTYTDNRAEFESVQSGKLIAVNPWLDNENALPYEIDRKSAAKPKSQYHDSISLAEFTQKGIDLLQDGPNGFFMMVESGKIDWACHANDARAAIDEVIALDNAIKVALDFAKEHPKETLIVVTGDHECGGMALGFAGTGYYSYFKRLQKQVISQSHFNDYFLSNYMTTHTPPPADIDTDMWQLILDNFGLDGCNLTATTNDDLDDFQKNQLEAAFDKVLSGKSNQSHKQDKLLYGSYNPISVSLTHILNKKAGLTWQSFSHTAAVIPVMATGPESDCFDGDYDNTDIAKKLMQILDLETVEPQPIRAAL